VSEAPGCPDSRTEPGRLAGGTPEGNYVRVGPASREAQEHEFARFLEADAGEGAGRRIAGRRVRTHGRRARALRADRESAAYAPGHGCYQENVEHITAAHLISVKLHATIN